MCVLCVCLSVCACVCLCMSVLCNVFCMHLCVQHYTQEKLMILAACLGTREVWGQGNVSDQNKRG